MLELQGVFISMRCVVENDGGNVLANVPAMIQPVFCSSGTEPG